MAAVVIRKAPKPPDVYSEFRLLLQPGTITLLASFAGSMAATAESGVSSLHIRLLRRAARQNSCSRQHALAKTSCRLSAHGSQAAAALRRLPAETRLQAAQRSFTPFLGLRPGLYCRVHCNTRFPPASMPRKQGRAMGVGAFPGYLLCACPVENCTVPRTALPMLLSRLCGAACVHRNASAGRRRVSVPAVCFRAKRICPPCLPNARCRETPDDAAKARRKNLAPVAASLAPLSATAKRESMEDGAGAVIFRRLQGCGRYCSSEARGFSSSGAASMVSLTTLAPAGGGGVPVARICS